MGARQALPMPLFQGFTLPVAVVTADAKIIGDTFSDSANVRILLVDAPLAVSSQLTDQKQLKDIFTDAPGATIRALDAAIINASSVDVRPVNLLVSDSPKVTIV